ncbi:hypothetical protein AB4068_15510 [Arthrobacter sp. 2RAF22]|uniref:hypothetical protein n=1 Tax=Arthrobacter sp. 2RAF22 TaxID=3232996 RepID=UPI003F92C0D8
MIFDRRPARAGFLHAGTIPVCLAVGLVLLSGCSAPDAGSGPPGSPAGPSLPSDAPTQAAPSPATASLEPATVKLK